MNEKIKKYFLLVFLGFLISCGNDDDASYVKTLPPFKTIQLNSVFDVYLLQDTTFSVKVTGDESVISQVQFAVKDDILSISNESKGKWLKPRNNKVKLYLRSNRLQSILINETCHIETIDPIIADNFNITLHPTPKLSDIDLELENNSFSYWNNHQCGGKLTLRGRTKKLTLYIFALMSVDARALIADEAFIQNSSKGDCEVTVLNKFEYSILNVGDIYLHGAPEEIIVREHSSSGQLIQLDE